LILGIAEITLPPFCTDKDPGMWTDPNPSLKPVFKGMPAGTVGFQRTFMANAQNGPCAGKGPFTFRAIDFSWMAHYNQTGLDPGVAPPPCATTNPVCPTAVFQGEWTTTDKMFDIVFSFQVSVDVVRPIGETTKFQGFTQFGFGAVGNWAATLMPPSSDKMFDFTGETTRERFTGGRGNCITPPTHLPLGQTTSAGSTFPVTNGPPGMYVDGVGFGDEGQSRCAILCNYVTNPAGCFFTRQQQMQIKSPADMDFVNYPAVNTLTATSRGTIVSIPSTQGFGTITSSRFPTPATPMPPLAPQSQSFLNSAVSVCPKGFNFPQDCR
jgi:hypothetical protein